MSKAEWDSTRYVHRLDRHKCSKQREMLFYKVICIRTAWVAAIVQGYVAAVYMT